MCQLKYTEYIGVLEGRGIPIPLFGQTTMEANTALGTSESNSMELLDRWDWCLDLYYIHVLYLLKPWYEFKKILIHLKQRLDK